MKEINFKKISFQNFFSVGNDSLDIKFSEGINLITGENLDNIGSKNGLGKTTILNFIYWVIFGKTIAELKKSRICNNITKGECSGFIQFVVDGDEYTIKRVLEPASIQVLKNDENITLSTIQKNDEFLQNLLGVNEEVFKNSVILTSDNTIPFMAQKKIDKRKFIEGVMNLNIFGEMLLKVRKDYNEKKKESDTEIAIFSNEQKNCQRLKDQKQTNIENRKQKIKDFEKRIEENNNKIEILQKEDKNVDVVLDKCRKLIDKKKTDQEHLENSVLPDAEKILSDAKMALNSKDLEISGIKKEINSLKESSGTCPTCKRPYSEDKCGSEDRLNELGGILKGLLKEQSDISEDTDKKLEQFQKIKGQISRIKSDISLVQKEIDRLVDLDNQIKIIESKNEEIVKNIENLKDENDNIDTLIQESEEKIKNLQENIKKLYKELDILEHAKTIVSEEGVKTVIIKKILTFLNGRMNYYLNVLDAPCNVSFDETFDNTIKTLTGKEIDYWNLSGGERKRVDSAVIFTFQDLLRMQTGINFNLFIADELFDSAVDEKGLTKILEILRTRVEKYKECIYLVSHNPNTEKFDIDNVVFLEKENGITRLKRDS